MTGKKESENSHMEEFEVTVPSTKISQRKNRTRIKWGLSAREVTDLSDTSTSDFTNLNNSELNNEIALAIDMKTQTGHRC